MYRSSLFLAAALVGTSIAFVQPAAAANSAAEVEAIARSVTVEIRLKNSVGSGVIIDRKGDIYTLVTNRHVVCGSGRCSKLSGGASYSLGLPDGQQDKVKTASVKLLGNDLDLAIIQFRSNRNYAVAKVEALGSLKIEDDVYTSGFPLERSGFSFGKGKTIAVVNKRLTSDKGGYTIAYDAPTLPGMSGGGVFDGNGQLVAIHGQGDRFRENTDVDNQSRINSKIGLNRGIPIRWLVRNLTAAGINVGGNRSVLDIGVDRAQMAASADEYFIAGFNKYVEPGSNVVAGKQQAIQDFGMAIRLNSRYQYAYFMRAVACSQVRQFQQSLSDYDKAIFLNPKYSEAYYNRANLKYEVLNDMPGALSDYNQAILLDPKYFEAYYNRANLKATKLNDIQGALSDYDQAILLNPKHSESYNNRAILKKNNLNDISGALLDYNQAILLKPKDFEAYHNRAILKAGKLNDMPGALSDFNQAILLNPRYSKAYYNRAILKKNNLNDIPGAIQDFRRAARLFREQGSTQGLQMAVEALQQLGVSE
jgi:tetratricopeptide (TPR) repeat protein